MAFIIAGCILVARWFGLLHAAKTRRRPWLGRSWNMIDAPRVLRRRLAVLSMLVGTSLVAACGGVVADLRDLVTLSGELSARYEAPAQVNVHNGTHMTIVFQNAPVAKLDSAGRAAFAREVAEYARATYPRAGALAEIRVGFSTTNGVGPVRVTRTETPYAWSIAELAPAAAAGDTGSVQ